MGLAIEGPMIAVVTAAVLLGSAFVLVLVDRWSRAARDALRSRYGGPRWKPAAVDALGLPLWMLLEVFCLALGLLMVVIVAATAYQAARTTRDWWHAGARRER